MLAATESSECLDGRRANRRFINQTMRAPLLSRAREIDLARRWRDGGDVDALHELISAYARLVVRAASHYRRYGLAVSDLIQEGIVGLLLAAARFDPGREARFSTYASWWVRSAMQDYVLRNWSLVRIGTTAAQKALFFNFKRLRRRIEGDSDGSLTADATRRIAADLKVGAGDVEAMKWRLSGRDRSLNALASDDGGAEWQDLLVDARPSPEEIAIETRDGAKRSRWLRAALAELPSRDREIISERRLRDDTVTLEALARRLGISKERVRQIEHRALNKIKQSVIRQSTAPAGHA